MANSGLGIWYNILHALAARARGYHVFLHHHVYNYVAEPDARMARLVRILGAHGTHVMLCPEMKASFRRLYGSESDALVVPGTIVLLDVGCRPATRPHTPFRIGHLSNLTLHKGLDEVLQTFAAVRRRGLPVELVLAGPTASARARRLIEGAQERFPRILDYRGPVYDDAKWSFFADIDVMLFPTRYDREAYPLVVAEALLAGAPVITYARACIPTLVGADGGHVLDPDADFAASALDVIEHWLQQPAAYKEAAERARARGKALREEARRDMYALVERLCGP